MKGNKRKRPKKANKRHGFRNALLIILLVLILTFSVLSLTIFFPIENIKLTGKSIYSFEQIVEVSGITQEDNMFLPLFNGSKQRIKKSLPYIKTVSYKYSLPGTIIIEVTPYTAAYQFHIKNDYVIAASDGVVLEVLSKEQESIPLIKVNALEYKVRDNFAFGDTGREEAFLKLTEALKDFGHTFNQLDITDPLDISLVVNDNTVLKLGSATYIPEKMKMAKKMLADIPKGEEGTLNLSAWSPENKQASYLKADE